MKNQNSLRLRVRFQTFAKFLTSLFCLFVGCAAVGAQTLKADYQFQNNLNSSVSGAPAMVNVTGQGTFQADTVDGYARQTFRFPAGSGLSVNTTGLISNSAYTAVILFRFDNVAGRRRIFDAKQAASNSCGLYIADSRLEVEPSSVSPIFQRHLYSSRNFPRRDRFDSLSPRRIFNHSVERERLLSELRRQFAVFH